MSSNQIKHINVTFLKLICKLLFKETMHFKDVKVEESSPRFFNVFLVSFQGFKGVLGLTSPCPDSHGCVENA